MIKQIIFTCIYINNDNEIIDTIKENIELQQENIISKPELVDVIKKYSFFLNKRYSILSILKYNILDKNNDNSSDNESCDSDESCSDSETNTIASFNDIDIDANFLTIIKNIEDIYLKNTNSMFQDLNEILLLFYEKTNIANININNKPSFSQTKRIYMNRKNKYRTTHRHKNIRA